MKGKELAVGLYLFAVPPVEVIVCCSVAGLHGHTYQAFCRLWHSRQHCLDTEVWNQKDEPAPVGGGPEASLVCDFGSYV